MMTKEEMRFQVALSCIQGVLEAKHGVIGEVVPAFAVAESLRLADEFVKQWFEPTIFNDNEQKKELPKWVKYEKGTEFEDDSFYITLDAEGKIWFSKGPLTEDAYVLTINDLKKLPFE